MALDYEVCSQEELLRFIVDRTRESLPDDLDKSTCIEILERTDRDARFRFLDLAPELRNGVYRELLVFDPDTGMTHLWPQILATSKQIRREAEGILYEENTFVVRIDCRRFEPIYPTRKTSSPVIMALSIICNGAAPLAWTCDEWPATLRGVHQLKVEFVSCESEQRKWSLKDFLQVLNYHLCSLMSFLGHDHKIKSFELDIQEPVRSRMGVLAKEVLWPLSLSVTGPSVEIKLVGMGLDIVDQLKARKPALAEHETAKLGAMLAAIERSQEMNTLARRTGEMEDSGEDEYFCDHSELERKLGEDRLVDESVARELLIYHNELLSRLSHGASKLKVAVTDHMNDIQTLSDQLGL